MSCSVLQTHVLLSRHVVALHCVHPSWQRFSLATRRTRRRWHRESSPGRREPGAPWPRASVSPTRLSMMFSMESPRRRTDLSPSRHHGTFIQILHWGRHKAVPVHRARHFFVSVFFILHRGRHTAVTVHRGRHSAASVHRGRHAAASVHHADRSTGWAAVFIYDGLARSTWRTRTFYDGLVRSTWRTWTSTDHSRG